MEILVIYFSLIIFLLTFLMSGLEYFDGDIVISLTL